MISRREVLAAAAALSCGRYDPRIPSTASYDEVLAALQATDFEFGGGLANHAPMAADALVAGGRADRVAAWAEQYALGRLMTLEAQPKLDPAARADALGVYEKRAAWTATYEAELQTTAADALIAREWTTLAPGYFAAGWHGVLRTAHAHRALARGDTPERRRELAQGLAFWAARFERLPGEAGSAAQSGLDVVGALKAVPLLPVSERKKGLIREQLAPLQQRPEFAAAVAKVDLDAQSFDVALAALASAAARVFAHGSGKDILLLHGITGTVALRQLAPLLDAGQRRDALGRAFHAVAAAYAVLGGGPSHLDPVEPAKSSASSLLERGLEDDDEHSIKLAEACIREHAVSGAPELLLAVERWLA